jgi:hypothetical protein
MRRARFWLFWCGWLASGIACASCNEADLVAHPSVVANTTVDAGSLECDYAAQLTRHSVPTGLASIFDNCEWLLRPDDESDDDELRRLLGDIPMTSETGAVCTVNPYYWWQEPLPPLPPQKLVYCPKSCEAIKTWLRCKLRDDPCSIQDPSNAPVDADSDAGELGECGP